MVMSSEEEIDKGIDQTALMPEAKALAKKNLKKGAMEAKKEFLKKYPYADLSKFDFSVLLDGYSKIKKHVVKFNLGKNIGSYEITDPTFLNNKEWTK